MYLETKIVDEVLSKTNGKFFTVTFEKKNGELRFLLGRLGVTKFLNGKGLSYNPSGRGNLIVYDMIVGGYRTVNKNKIVKLQSRGIIYNN